jgi:hypothetical protein
MLTYLCVECIYYDCHHAALICWSKDTTGLRGEGLNTQTDSNMVVIGIHWRKGQVTCQERKQMVKSVDRPGCTVVLWTQLPNSNPVYDHMRENHVMQIISML